VCLEPGFYKKGNVHNAKPAQIQDITFFKPKYNQSEAVLDEEKRKTSVAVRANKRPKLDKRQLLIALHACSPNSAIFSVVYGYTDFTVIRFSNEAEQDYVNQLYDLYHSQMFVSDMSQL
jgi:hypothetical protein